MKQWEGLRTKAYRDAGGVWTIGYGHTATAGSPVPRRGQVITESEAERILLKDLTQYEAAVESLVKVKLNDNQFAALVSFTFNVGIENFKRSNLLKKLNKGNFNAVPTELTKWTKASGKKIQGLVNRRAGEAGLWVKESFVSSAYVKPTPPKNVLEYSGASLLAAAPNFVGYVNGNGPIQWAIAVISVMIIGFLAYKYFFK